MDAQVLFKNSFHFVVSLSEASNVLITTTTTTAIIIIAILIFTNCTCGCTTTKYQTQNISYLLHKPKKSLFFYKINTLNMHES